MDVLIAIVLAVVVFIAGIAGNLLAAEFYDRSSNLARWLIKHAAARLSEQERARYLEEWLAHLEDCPGKLGRLWHAIGCVVAVHRVRETSTKQHIASDANGQLEFFIRLDDDELVIMKRFYSTVFGARLKTILTDELSPNPGPDAFDGIIGWRRYRVRKTWKVSRVHKRGFVEYVWNINGRVGFAAGLFLLREFEDCVFKRDDDLG